MKRRVASLAAVLAAASSLGGCGSSSSPTTPGASPTPGPNTVALGALAPIVNQFFAVPVNTTRAGTLTLQVNWTSATDVLSVGIATSSCTLGAYLSSTCSFLAVDANPSTAPSKTLTAPGVAAGSYVVIIHNLGPANESVTYSLTLTPA